MHKYSYLNARNAGAPRMSAGVSSMSASRPSQARRDASGDILQAANVASGRIGKNMRLIVEGEDTDSDIGDDESDTSEEQSVFPVTKMTFNARVE